MSESKDLQQVVKDAVTSRTVRFDVHEIRATEVNEYFNQEALEPTMDVMRKIGVEIGLDVKRFNTSHRAVCLILSALGDVAKIPNLTTAASLEAAREEEKASWERMIKYLDNIINGRG